MNHLSNGSIAFTLFLVAAPAAAQTPVDVVRVAVKSVERQVKLPGEFQPYLAVPIYAKLPGFVKRVAVDRGSSVEAGQAQVQSVKDLEQYLTLKAPFDGIITERTVHPGALVGQGANSPPLLRLHQI